MIQVTQNDAQALVSAPSSAVAAQLNSAALVAIDASAVASSVSVSALYELLPEPPALASTVVEEALFESDGLFFADSMFASALIENVGAALAGQVVFEVLYDYKEIQTTGPIYDPMSDYLFPKLPGLAWDVVKTPEFSTQVSGHVSGREVRVSNRQYPTWIFEMSYEFLRSGAKEELQQIAAFFLRHRGKFGSFLYEDAEEDNQITQAFVGAGNGARTSWTLFKTFAGFSEPCGYVDPASISVYLDSGVGAVEQLSGWSFSSPNQIVFDVPVPGGVVVIADYTWYYRVRFGEDTQDYQNFMYQLWELGSLTLRSIKP